MSASARMRAAAAALAMAALAAGQGCALLPFRSGPAGPEQAGATAPEVPDPVAADSLVAESAPADESPATGAAGADSTALAGSAVAPDAPQAAVPPPPPPDPEATDQVKVQISDAERAELETRARESLREARRVIRTIDRATLTAERLEKLTTVESLVESARAAFDTDIRAAATLAHKASVLLAELTTN